MRENPAETLTKLWDYLVHKQSGILVICNVVHGEDVRGFIDVFVDSFPTQQPLESNSL